MFVLSNWPIQLYLTCTIPQLFGSLVCARSMVERPLRAQDWWCPQQIPHRLRMTGLSAHSSRPGQVGQFRRSSWSPAELCHWGHVAKWKGLQHLPFELDHSSSPKDNYQHLLVDVPCYRSFGIIYPQIDLIVATFSTHEADGIANSPWKTSHCDIWIYLTVPRWSCWDCQMAISIVARVKTLKKQPVEGWRGQNIEKNNIKNTYGNWTSRWFQSRGLKSILFGNTTRSKQALIVHVCMYVYIYIYT